VLRDRGAIVGTSSARTAQVELIGGRRFFVFRSLLPGAAAEHAHAVIRSTFRALDAEREDGQDPEALGMCVVLSPEMRRQLPSEAEWRDPHLLHAGYLRDGTQVRIAYFGDQFDLIDGEGWMLAPGCRADLFAEQDDVAPADVIALWTEGARLSPEEAERRLSEVLMVGTDPQRQLVVWPPHIWGATSNYARSFGTTGYSSRARVVLHTSACSWRLLGATTLSGDSSTAPIGEGSE
jgi:hypothetical protein